MAWGSRYRVEFGAQLYRVHIVRLEVRVGDDEEDHGEQEDRRQDEPNGKDERLQHLVYCGMVSLVAPGLRGY